MSDIKWLPDGQKTFDKVMAAVPDEMRDAITAGETLNQLSQLAKKNGMRTLLEDGFDKVRQGLTTVEEIIRVTTS